MKEQERMDILRKLNEEIEMRLKIVDLNDYKKENPEKLRWYKEIDIFQYLRNKDKCKLELERKKHNENILKSYRIK